MKERPMQFPKRVVIEDVGEAAQRGGHNEIASIRSDTRYEQVSKLKRHSVLRLITSEQLKSIPPQLPVAIASTYQKIGDLYDQMQEQVASFNTKVETLIAKEERSLFGVCSLQLSKMQEEILTCRQQLQQALTQVANSDAAKAAEAERMENLRLASTCGQQREEIKRLNTVIEQLQGEKAFLEKQVKKTKRENKNLQLSLNRVERIARTHSEVGKYPSVRVSTQNEELSNLPPNSGRKGKDPAEPPEDEERLAKVEEFFQSLNNVDPKVALANSKTYCDKLVAKSDRIIASLQHQLRHEKKLNAQLKSAQTASVASSSELQQLFCDCVEEAKRNLQQQVLSPSRESKIAKIYYQNRGKKQKGDLASSVERALKPAHKAMIMERFLLDDQVLQSLYQLVFHKPIRAPRSKYTVAVHPSSRSAIGNEGSQSIFSSYDMSNRGGQPQPTATLDESNQSHLPPVSNSQDLLKQSLQPLKDQLYRRGSRRRNYFVKNGKLTFCHTAI